MSDKELTSHDFGVEPRAENLREKICQLETVMLAMPEQAECPVTHHFVPGLYAREILIPKGVTFTSKLHRTEHLVVISKGDISVLTENGIERVQAPYTFITKPGTKRVGFAHEDTVWTTFHVTNETDLEKIEAYVISPSYEQFELEQKTKLITD